jgi:hypothetical protein
MDEKEPEEEELKTVWGLGLVADEIDENDPPMGELITIWGLGFVAVETDTKLDI